MIDKNCKNYETMILTPCEGRGWEVLDWCYIQGCAIEGECAKDCPYRNKSM